MKEWLLMLVVVLVSLQFPVFNAFGRQSEFGPDAAIIAENGLAETIVASNDLLQFTSEGHILGFAHDRVYMAGMGNLLTEEFVGAKEVAPVSAGPRDQEDNLTKVAPELVTVCYPNLWEGITVSYEASQGGLTQSTYVISPGAAVSQIKLRYNADAKIQDNGSLRFAHPAEKGFFTMTAPIAWQEIEGKKVMVDVAFYQLTDDVIGFQVGKYDNQHPLIIDPTYQWHTFLGSAATDRGHGIALDGSGNVYVAGFSSATWGTPVNGHSGGGDIVIVKLNNAGGLIWNTFHGSASDDSGYGIALDPAGNIYVSGYSTATWGSSPVNAYSGSNDIVVLKLNTAGVLQWNTFHGSTGYDVIDFAGSIAVDTDGNSYVAGRSNATWGAPVSPNSGGGDIVVFKLDRFGALQWNTFQGSASSDNGYGIAVDTGGNAYVTGYSNVTWGTPVNGHGGDHEIVIFKLNGSGALQWNTFHGSGNFDEGYGIALDPAGNIYVTARSEATWGSPVNAHSGNSDMAVIKLNNAGVLQWNTFHGSASNDYGYQIAVADGSVYVTGQSYITWGTPVNPNNGNDDMVVFKLNDSGSLQWNTFIGGMYSDQGNDIVAAGGALYITGESNFTWGDPIDPFERTEVNSLGEIVVLKLSDQESPILFPLTVNKTGTGSGAVTSSPGGINCGSTCSATIESGTAVTLTANPAPGSVFAGWSGAITGTDPVVQLTMDAAKTCTARFNLEGGGAAIPTMTEWGMIVMSLVLAGSAIWMIRRRQIL
jgi:hypothetical protein